MPHFGDLHTSPSNTLEAIAFLTDPSTVSAAISKAPDPFHAFDAIYAALHHRANADACLKT